MIRATMNCGCLLAVTLGYDWRGDLVPSKTEIFQYCEKHGVKIQTLTPEQRVAIANLVEATSELASEAADSVEYSDWPELQEAIEKASKAIEEARKLL